MSSTDIINNNPFVDPSINGSRDSQPNFDGEATLIVGRNACLSLGTDSLIVLG